MSKIIYAQLVSADGYIEDKDGKIDWTKPGEELNRHFNELEKNLYCGFSQIKQQILLHIVKIGHQR